ncbi:MAG: glycosyltransferase family 4 protein [Candidatus Tectomicrobia bacterium]|nr:glycosyltransferase family 4 protein [Candidatus Tectomicrobia bacterium]
MKRVLMVTYFFPPLAGGGVYRSVKFVKYLSKVGWEPIVLTVGKGSFHWVHDRSLLREISEETEIVRTRSFEPFLFNVILGKIGLGKLYNFMIPRLFIPDTKVGWIPISLVKGLSIIRKRGIDLIFSTSPPHSAHLIGYFLKRWTRTPWVADFRDHWTLDPMYTPPSEWRYRFDEALERKILEECDRVVVTTEGNRRDLLKVFQLPVEKVMTITNGYDAEDFQESLSHSRKHDRFIITYTGTFYGTRSPEPFFRSLRLLVDQHPETRKLLEVRILGQMEDRFRKLVDELYLEDLVSISNFVPHSEALRTMLTSDLLLLIISSDQKNENVLTGKIFEYMAAEKPILALIPQGEASRLLTESGLGVITNPDDIEGIYKTLYHLLQKWQNGEVFSHPCREFIRQFERKRLTEQLAHLFDDLLLERERPRREVQNERI